MSPTTASPEYDKSIAERAAVIYSSSLQTLYRQIDRIFAVLMPLQWVAGIAAAIWISPRAWSGVDSQIHLHVWAAILLGGVLCSLPMYLVARLPGQAATRQVIAISQMLWSALLIHLTGGRIETHFHVFGSLAILSCYRDWRVLATATGVIAADHLVRGYWLPASVFGVDAAPMWRALEHAGWVVFEDLFLVCSFPQCLRDVRVGARQQAELEVSHRLVECRVEERTRELAETNASLVSEIRDRCRAEEELRNLQARHLETARRAGMAEIATSVLHNVGNVLNSVNVSAGVIRSRLEDSGAADLRQVIECVEQHAANLGEYVTNDPRGQHLPAFLITLGRQIADETEATTVETELLIRNIEHIKGIVSLQLSYAGVSGVLEQTSIGDLVEDSIRINAASMDRHDIQTELDIADIPPLLVEKQKLMQIIVNLISNAKYALKEGHPPEKRMIVRAERCGANRMQVHVTDNGVGILRENLTRIFSHGFTTRQDGHGFGLHSAANLARELGGTLTVKSEGFGRGAQFTLDIPLSATAAAGYETALAQGG